MKSLNVKKMNDILSQYPYLANYDSARSKMTYCPYDATLISNISNIDDQLENLQDRINFQT